MSSASSSSDSDDELEDELSRQAADLEATVSLTVMQYLAFSPNDAHHHCTYPQLQESPYYYEGHVKLIQLLRQQGDLDKARDARLNMSRVYPLSEG